MESGYSGNKNYADRRPGYVRQHIISKFGANGVTGTSFVTLNTDTAMGHIKINSIDIQSGTRQLQTLIHGPACILEGFP